MTYTSTVPPPDGLANGSPPGPRPNPASGSHAGTLTFGTYLASHWVGLLRQRTPAQLIEQFRLENGLPNIHFAEAVWGALTWLGRELPEDERPGQPRPWQPLELRLFLDFPRASLQGARQGSGKTFIAALVIACCSAAA